jgi:hypothetical protein
MKKVVLTAFLPQLPAGHAYQETEGSGSSLAVAISRAVHELLARPHVKGRRLDSMKLAIVVKE